jgi:hypothetical protein
MGTYEELGKTVGALVDEKNKAYGAAFDNAGAFLTILYPNGIQPEQYGHALALVRIFDKMMRIATDKDAFGESPFQDIAGYGLLGLQKANMQKQLESLKKAQEILSNTIKDIPQDPEDYYNEIK